MLGPIKRIGQTYRHFNRYREILGILVKYGFDDLLANLQVQKYIAASEKAFSKPKAPLAPQINRWDRFRMVLEELGPTFIKLGQLLSNRPELIPPEGIIALERLQDNVPPFPVEQSRELVEKELGKPIEEVFSSFQNIPIASASIAQVHAAELINGTKVAIKVRRPGISQRAGIDIEILYHLASLAEKYNQSFAALQPLKVVEDFERTIRKEMDFSLEASSLQRFDRNFRGEKRIYVPNVYREFTTRKVLVMEFIVGTKVSRLQSLPPNQLDAKTISSNGADLILTQIFRHGFFHGDPHPGNILILPDNVVCFLDFGIMGSLSETHREHLGSAIVALVSHDAHGLTHAILQFTQAPLEKAEILEAQVSEMLDQYASLPLKDIPIAEILNRLIRIIVTSRLQMPQGFFLLLKTIITTEGIGKQLDPNFDMIEHMRPFAVQIMRQKLNPYRLIKTLYLASSEVTPALRDLPLEAIDTIRQIRSGKIQIRFRHQGLEPMMNKAEQLVTRLIFAIVLASLVVGSSIVVHSQVPPFWHGFPLIGVLGYTAAMFIAFWLLISILRKGRM